MAAAAEGHATIRETYDLVSETRQELNERIDGLGAKIDSFVTTSEHRLTVLETHQASEGDRLNKIDDRLDQHGKILGELKERQQQDEAAEEAIEEQSKTHFSARTTVVALIASIVVSITAVLSLFHIRLY